ncbi:MAG: hypothetical protein ACM34K_16080 [Bacillota bacterium]
MESLVENNSDEILTEFPVPLIFNCWKHHLQFIRKQINFYASKGTSGLLEIHSKLLLIGTSQIDLYLGKLSEWDVISQVIEILQKLKVYGEHEYLLWVRTSSGQFRMIELPDHSFWTLREGTQHQRYIHIHPGRHTLYSIRIRSNTLKTAILASLVSKINNSDLLDLKIINNIRVKTLNLAPLKSIEKSNGLKELVLLINEQN